MQALVGGLAATITTAVAAAAATVVIAVVVVGCICVVHSMRRSCKRIDILEMVVVMTVKMCRCRRRQMQKLYEQLYLQGETLRVTLLCCCCCGCCCRKLDKDIPCLLHAVEDGLPTCPSNTTQQSQQ